MKWSTPHGGAAAPGHRAAAGRRLVRRCWLLEGRRPAGVDDLVERDRWLVLRALAAGARAHGQDAPLVAAAAGDPRVLAGPAGDPVPAALADGHEAGLRVEGLPALAVGVVHPDRAVLEHERVHVVRLLVVDGRAGEHAVRDDAAGRAGGGRGHQLEALGPRGA